jgi:DNA-binding Lrp family transcriptional regulator
MSKEQMAALDAAMMNIYVCALRELNYNAKLFHNMLSERGGLATAKALINAAKPSDGYTALYERNRLDLTVEAVVLRGVEWPDLFEVEELNRARKRLQQYGYNV